MRQVHGGQRVLMLGALVAAILGSQQGEHAEPEHKEQEDHHADEGE